MATLVFSAVGASIGGSVLGTVVGTALGTAVGRGVGSIIGRHLDERIFGSGSATSASPPMERLRVMTSHVGESVPQVYGRARVAGQVIWATDFTATPVDGGNKYSVSLAVALCEGIVHRIGRVWVNDQLVSLNSDQLRLHKGQQDQEVDPLISTIEGEDSTPNYGGLAYIVLEDFDLTEFGNYIPNFQFEVFSHPVVLADNDVKDLVRATTIIPGSGEFVLGTSPVIMDEGQGIGAMANVHRENGLSDFENSIGQMLDDLPKLEHSALVVSWFGNDLRCDHCIIEPRVDQKLLEGDTPWQVAGLTRADATQISQIDGNSVYGGTPSDHSVIEAIEHLNERGQKVMFYPFIMMDIAAENGLVDPYNPFATQQVNPWRGRITLPIASGVDGSVEGTSGAMNAVDDFLGSAHMSDFNIDDGLDYTGPEAWGYRRFILHYAYLCKIAGGVDSFLIGSELRGLTTIRAQGQAFPFVEAMIDLAAQVRTILGPNTKISYAADWSEYYGYHPAHEPGSAYFHLDPFWADDNVDFIGIDNYMPLSDWRHGFDHLDAAAGSVYDIDYLKSNVMGGEGFDWFYANQLDRDAQIRTPITDGQGESWVWKYKDITSWWSNPHYNRPMGVRDVSETDWVPQSKPICFTEYGAAALEFATNQPNKFLDSHSSESSLPYYSSGTQDSFAPAQYITAINQFWNNDANNPQSTNYDGPMVDMSRAYYWTWDARPWPEFPARSDVWSDAENYGRGHWLTGRVNAPKLANVVTDICAELGDFSLDITRLYGLVQGVAFRGDETMRERLEILMRAYQFQMFFDQGQLVFVSDNFSSIQEIDENLLLSQDDGQSVKTQTAALSTRNSLLELHFVNGDDQYQRATALAELPTRESSDRVAAEVGVSLSPETAENLADFMLQQATHGEERISFWISNLAHKYRVGDLIQLPHAKGGKVFRIDRISHGEFDQIEALHAYQKQLSLSEGGNIKPGPTPTLPKPVIATFVDVNIGNEVGIYVAVGARPWGGAVEIGEKIGDQRKSLAVINRPSTMGRTISDLGAGDAHRRQNQSVEIRLTNGQLSIDDDLLAFGPNELGDYELLRYGHAELIADDSYRLSGLYRGLHGTEVIIDDWPTGTSVVLMDTKLGFIPRSQLADVDLHQLVYGPVSDSQFEREQKINDPKRAEMPLSPSHITAKNDGGDLTVSFRPRNDQDRDIWRDGQPSFTYPVNFHVKIGDFEIVTEQTEITGIPIPAGVFIIKVAAISAAGIYSDYTKETINVTDL